MIPADKAGKRQEKGMESQPPLEVDGRPVGWETGPRGVEPERPTVIFIHGAGGSRLSWQAQLRPLDKEINVVALELPGHGRSPGPPPETVAGYAAWVARFLEVWPPPSRPVLAGHSMGGAITLECALTRPELLAGLILIGTGARLWVNPALLEGLIRDFEATIRKIIGWSFSPETGAEVVRQSEEIMLQSDPAVMLNDFTACDGFDRRADLGRITLPTLIICGAEEKMAPPKLSEELAARIPESRLEMVEKAGHMVAAEKPAEVNRAVADFVRRVG